MYEQTTPSSSNRRSYSEENIGSFPLEIIYATSASNVDVESELGKVKESLERRARDQGFTTPVNPHHNMVVAVACLCPVSKAEVKRRDPWLHIIKNTPQIVRLRTVIPLTPPLKLLEEMRDSKGQPAVMYSRSRPYGWSDRMRIAAAIAATEPAAAAAPSSRDHFSFDSDRNGGDEVDIDLTDIDMPRTPPTHPQERKRMASSSASSRGRGGQSGYYHDGGGKRHRPNHVHGGRDGAAGMSTMQKAEGNCPCPDHFASGNCMSIHCRFCVACNRKATESDHKPDTPCASCGGQRVLKGHEGITPNASSVRALENAIRAEVTLALEDQPFDSDEQKAEKLETLTAALLEAAKGTESGKVGIAVKRLETEEDLNRKLNAQLGELERWRKKRHVDIEERGKAEHANIDKEKAALDAKGKRVTEREVVVKRKIDELANVAKNQAEATRPTKEAVAALRDEATAAWAAFKVFYSANMTDPTAEVYSATLKPFALRLALENKTAATDRWAKILAMDKTAPAAEAKGAPATEAKAAPVEEAKVADAADGE